MIKIAVPARLCSSRIKNKMLIQINGETVIEKTVKQIMKSDFVGEIHVFTDSEKISNVINKNFLSNIECHITPDYYSNGTERISDNINFLDQCDHIMIILGDQPFLNYTHINILLDYYKTNEIPNNQITTLYSEISENEANDLSIAKIVTSNNDFVHYISRSVIPCNYKNNKFSYIYKKHISIVVIPYQKLKLYYLTPNTQNQLMEDNEWIKFIDLLDCKIKCLKVSNSERDVNTIDDLNYLINKYCEQVV